MSSSYVESLRVRNHCVACDAAELAVDEVINVRLTTNSGLLGAGAFVAVVEAILMGLKMATSSGVSCERATAKRSMFGSARSQMRDATLLSGACPTRGLYPGKNLSLAIKEL